MPKITAPYLNDFLYDPETGFLMRFHFKHGMDMDALDKLYKILEELRFGWRDKKEVPKDILYHLIIIVPALYNDLELYKDTASYYVYQEEIYELTTAIEMSLNPNPNDIQFQKPLRR